MKNIEKKIIWFYKFLCYRPRVLHDRFS